ncbi:DUF2059 domain-containing protein [Sphingomonas sp. NSE70-1]|uniref:DUF2059 domain-containing protein n=1 Tax=Sphingomonas caseinilyticus TaxID=2908205 RepID=A0ABT0RUR2_9SPHN|nr:DUF2059 domain-containing protein [Sphingomonas caseinilyticus]MCL6698762.1 DUF2059 domain-containing protein [Sphingomonas caseinilyticus]
MRSLIALGVALMIAAPVGAMASSDAVPPTAQASPAEAIALAQLMSPRDLLIDMEVREFDKHFVPSLGADPEMKALEDQYPGLFEAMHKASRGLVVEATGRSVGKIHVSVAKLIQSNFTPADIVELSDFYRSPVGQKTLRQMAAAADAGQVYQRAVAETDFKLTEDQIAAQLHDSAQKTAQSFTPEEQTAMLLFMAKPSFGKLARTQPQIQKLLADEFNAPDPDFDRQVEQAISAAIEQHIASFEKPGGQ